MPRFSLRQIFIGIVALAAGLSIWRLPTGNWIDVPLSALSVCFVLSLCRHAVATRRSLVEHPGLHQKQAWGGRILMVELLGAAIALIVALVFAYLTAAELLLEDTLYIVELATLPRDLAALAMLVATGLATWQICQGKSAAPRQQIYLAVATVGVVVAVILYWTIAMQGYFSSYLWLSYYESYESPQSLPPEMNVRTALRIHRFAAGSFAGLSLAIANLLFLGAVVKWWNKPLRRLMFAMSLAAGLAAECWFAGWIAVRGVRQLSPPLHEAMQLPPFEAIIVVVSMILLALGGFTWRALAKPPPVDHAAHVACRSQYFHETWLGSLLLAAVATTQVGDVFVALNSPFRPNSVYWWERAFYSTFSPTQFIWLAAAIGGFALAWSRWHRRTLRIGEILPCVDPTLFSLTMLSLSIVVLASAPILAAVGLSFWLLQG